MILRTIFSTRNPQGYHVQLQQGAEPLWNFASQHPATREDMCRRMEVAGWERRTEREFAFILGPSPSVHDMVMWFEGLLQTTGVCDSSEALNGLLLAVQRHSTDASQLS